MRNQQATQRGDGFLKHRRSNIRNSILYCPHDQSRAGGRHRACMRRAIAAASKMRTHVAAQHVKAAQERWYSVANLKGAKHTQCSFLSRRQVGKEPFVLYTEDPDIWSCGRACVRARLDKRKAGQPKLVGCVEKASDLGDKIAGDGAVVQSASSLSDTAQAYVVQHFLVGLAARQTLLLYIVCACSTVCPAHGTTIKAVLAIKSSFSFAAQSLRAIHEVEQP